MSVSTLYLRFPDLFGLFLHRYKVLHCITILTILDVEIKDNPLTTNEMTPKIYTLTVKQNGIVINRTQSDSKNNLTLKAHKILLNSQVFRGQTTNPSFTII